MKKIQKMFCPKFLKDTFTMLEESLFSLLKIVLYSLYLKYYEIIAILQAVKCVT